MYDQPQVRRTGRNRVRMQAVFLASASHLNRNGIMSKESRVMSNEQGTLPFVPSAHYSLLSRAFYCCGVR